MPNTPIQGYQIGYRVKGQGGYTEPYVDLPMHRVEDYAVDGCYCADAAFEHASNLCRQLKADFPDAEWRIVEVWG